jgi:hypothetical protein
VLVGGAEMDVHVEIGEGDGLALGVFGGGGVHHFWRGGAMRQAGWVVVWPFSSMEREKMTLPPGWVCWRAAGGRGGEGAGGVGGGLRSGGAAMPAARMAAAARGNFMSPGLSVFSV